MYIGHIEYGKKINLSYKSKKVKLIPREEWQIVENTHEPIISKEQFDRVQTRLNLRKITKQKRHSWFLNGLVYCKECGSKMVLRVIYNKDGSIKATKLVCGNAVRKGSNLECNRKHKAIYEKVINDVVIENVEKKLNGIINNKELKNIIKEQYNQSGTKVFDNNIETLKKQLDKTEKIITSLYEDYKNEIIEVDDYKRFYKTEAERRINLKNQINNLIEQKENIPILTEEKLLSVVEKLSNIKKWNRERLAEIIYNIEVDINNNIYINYKYSILDRI